MVVTRSQSRREISSPKDPRRANGNGTAVGPLGDASQNLFEERLGRGCRVPREPPASYDSLYVAAALLPPSRRRHSEGEIQVNSRYPERDAAKRALLRMSSTLHSLDEDSLQSWKGHDESDGGNEEKSSVENGSEGEVTPSPLRSKKCNGNRARKMLGKRHRDVSIDSSITDESLREQLHGRDKEGEEEMLFDERSSSLSSSAKCMSDTEAFRVCRNAKESISKNVSINHYLREVIQDAAADEKKAKKRFGKSHRRRMEDLFLGFDDVRSGSPTGGDAHGRMETPMPLGDITPLHIDTSVSFERVGGLPGHVVMLREMVLFPLLYPQVLQAMNLTPPRGVLFVGPPGTGKTLMARALANEAANCAQRKIAFFMRKGADILSKWVGESERQLSLLFEEAKRRQPSIIFFDEIDGLAPVRHLKTEQSQAALVSTLLALVDGLDDRGQVIVIGATNRPDTLDPALRRPGRLDRELYFPLPDAAARRHILSIVTQPMLPVDHPERGAILEELVTRCEGWSGAEIQALCTEAGLNRLRTSLPQIYTTSRRLQVPIEALSIQKDDFFIAAHRIKSSVRRGVAPITNSLEEHLEHLLNSTRNKLTSHVAGIWPSAATSIANERRDCSDIKNAVRDLSGFSIPHIAHPMLLFLTATFQGNSHSNDVSKFALEKATLALIKSLPSIRTYTLHLPHLAVDRSSVPVTMAPMTTPGTGGDANNPEEHSAPQNGCFFSGHIYSCILALQRFSGPSLVFLQGLDVWLAENGIAKNSSGGEKGDSDDDSTERQKNMEALCYYLNFLCNSDVLIIAPTLHVDVCSRFFSGGQLNTQLRTVVYKVPCVPTDNDLRRFIHYLFRVVDLALSHCVPVLWEELPDSPLTPPPPSLEELSAVRRGALDLWRRVEYRRRQLRHVLTKWVGQYLNSRKFSMFFSADLDLTPGHGLYEGWRRLTHGRRIGLCDIMEKLENEEYTCLSQYHDDIDMLVRNVRMFFRTRSAVDQRYRSRALELKEATVLNLYKINRKVVHFCERHKDLAEPDVSLSSASHNSANKLTQPAQTGPEKSVTPAKRRRPSRRYYGSRRRRRRSAPMNSGISPGKTFGAVKVETDGNKIGNDDEREEEEEGENGNEEGDVIASTSENKLHAGSGVASTAKGDMNVVSKGDGVPEINAIVQTLKGLSFLHLHRVFQVAMSLLEEELSGRRKRQQQRQEQPQHRVSDPPPSAECTRDETVLFFQGMVKKALQASNK